MKRCSHKGCIKERKKDSSLCEHHVYLLYKDKSLKYKFKNRKKILKRQRKYIKEHLKESKIYRNNTVNGFLSRKYSNMRRRVLGKQDPRYHKYYLGKPIMPREVFYEWAKNHPDFQKLFKRWVMSKNDRKLTPVVNRIDSAKGYTLDNVEWITNSQNCALAGTVKSLGCKKSVYKLLGVN